MNVCSQHYEWGVLSPDEGLSLPLTVRQTSEINLEKGFGSKQDRSLFRVNIEGQRYLHANQATHGDSPLEEMSRTHVTGNHKAIVRSARMP